MIVLYKKRNKGVVGVQDRDGNTWHTKGAFEDRDMVKGRSPSPMSKGGRQWQEEDAVVPDASAAT